MKKADRRNQIMTHAIKLARQIGYMNVRRDDLASKAGVANGLVSAHWSTMAQLRTAIIREAVKIGDPVIVGQGLALKNRHAMRASQELKDQAIAHIAG